MASQRDRLANLWTRCAGLPAGRRIFSILFGQFVPYSGSIGAVIQDLAPGYCRLTIDDRRALRNHLRSIHAVALVNAGEMTSGLAMTMALPPEIRGIVTSIGADYPKKARGRLTATSSVAVPPVGDLPVDHRVETTITDHAGDVVCRVFTVWRLARADREQARTPRTASSR
jgi:acyl-coenzyme A thioesterase PaaI-like protein